MTRPQRPVDSDPMRPAIAIIDDYQHVALQAADWSAVAQQADVRVFTQPWRDEDELVQALAPFDIVVLMRERTPFPARRDRAPAAGSR